MESIEIDLITKSYGEERPLSLALMILHGQKIEELKLSSFLNEIFFLHFFWLPLNIYSQEVDASDILFLKIQELEGELASLRSELESQAYSN